MAKNNFDSDYKPHEYIKDAIEKLKGYCLPYGLVKITNSETCVIVALILYIIAKEPKVNHTKLECYAVLLNHMINEATGTNLFTWELESKMRIGNFKEFFNYMVRRGIINLKGRSNFVILGGAKGILSKLNLILHHLIPYISKLLNKYENYTAKEMLKETEKLEET